MRRPVVKEEIVELMRQRQKQVTGSLKELRPSLARKTFPLFPMKRSRIFDFSWRPYSPRTFWRLGRQLVFQPS